MNQTICIGFDVAILIKVLLIEKITCGQKCVNESHQNCAEFVCIGAVSSLTDEHRITRNAENVKGFCISVTYQCDKFI